MIARLLPTAGFALVGSMACNAPLKPDRLQPRPGEKVHATVVRIPEKLSSVEAQDATDGAQKMRVTCVVCHSLREDQPLPIDESALNEFHVGLSFVHGDLACASCHTPGIQDTLHLATGQEIPMLQAIRLCAQCHGSQWRDYQRGAHGGMLGYWDLSRGSRTKNHCVDCHDPHAPKFIGGRPVLAPRDRFLEAPEDEP